MKPHALETVRNAIAIRADIRCSVRCGADAEHDRPPRCYKGVVRSCLCDPLPATGEFQEALINEVDLDPLRE